MKQTLKPRASFIMRLSLSMMLCIFLEASALAHPGSGIVVDKNGQVYFTDTGKGVWKIDKQGKLTFMPSSRFHWMAIDESGFFANSDKSFGGYFERVTEKGVKPALIICSDFPFVINTDGNLYYADTRPGSSKIIRRTAGGKESIVATNKIFQFVSGIAAGPDGSLYITEASDPLTNTIRKIQLNGQLSIHASYAGERKNDLSTGNLASYCRGLAVDPTGTVYVAATGNRSVLKISKQGSITEILRSPSPWAPTGVTIFNGEVFVLEWHDVPPALDEVREAWIPRVEKISREGKVTILASVSRN